MVLTLRRVLITDEIAQQCIDILKRNGIEVVKNTALAKNKGQLLNEIKEFDGLVVRSGTKVSADIINAGSRLQIIGRAGTGVDNIDCEAATRKGVIVMNTPGGNTMSAAEHTCAMMCAMTRHIPQGTESMRAGRWDRKKYMGSELYGKTLAIIGLGRIGREVASRMQSFGMTTIGYDPLVSAEESAEFKIEWMELEKIWPLADYVTVHVPLIPPTKNLISEKVFNIAKKGVRIINVARGGIVDESALLEALNNGQCGGAALDVFLEEPPTNKDLIAHPLCISTPHLGASTVEAQTRVAEEIAQQFVDAAEGKELIGAVNAAALSNALSEASKPWVALGQAMGALASTLVPTVNGDTQLQIITQGSSMKGAGAYLKSAVLMGLLKVQVNNGINLVNAPMFAKDNGVQAKTEHKEGSASQLVVIIQQNGLAPHQLTGHAAGSSAILTEMSGCVFPNGCTLGGNVLVYTGPYSTQTFPTVAAAISQGGSSITSYSGSSEQKGVCYSLVGLESPLQNLDAIKQNVNSVHQVSL
ncbi:unnamed protein product [Owenia fusiformis]|uniref:D-3-phosphoglycerate dehydrogenase n=1 Tax=Owenia fusiformis TaxID=6347 RepID=A0A8J1XS41_OWEFU|nr:unnamed protein product [Owenia fusiformis]